MELKDVINQMIGEGMQAAQLTDLAIEIGRAHV